MRAVTSELSADLRKFGEVRRQVCGYTQADAARLELGATERDNAWMRSDRPRDRGVSGRFLLFRASFGVSTPAVDFRVPLPFFLDAPRGRRRVKGKAA